MLLEPDIKPDVPWLRRRLRELYLPLLTAINGTNEYALLEGLVKTILEERIASRRDSFEGYLTRAVIKLIGQRQGFDIPAEDIWVELKETLDGIDHPNKPNQMQTELFGIITKQLVGRRLREVLGSRTRFKWEGRAERVHVFDPKKLMKAAKKYCITDITTLTDSPEYTGLQKGLEMLRKSLETQEIQPLCLPGKS
jgi:hypothetical protein